MQQAQVKIKGSGLGRDAVLRSIRRSDILLSFIRDVTPMHIMVVGPRKNDV